MNRFKLDFATVKQKFQKNDLNFEKTKNQLKKEQNEIPLNSDLKGKLKCD